MSPQAPHPPRLAEALARRLLPRDVHGRAILGDLHEEYRDVLTARGPLRAGVWYWGQVLAVGVGYAWPRTPGLSRSMQDLRYGARGLRRTPLFTLAVVLTLALGIGASTAIYSVVDAILLSPLPFDQPERLVRVWASDEARGRPSLDMVYGDDRALAEGVDGFDAVTSLSVAPRTLLDERGENPEETLVARTWGDLFGVLGVEAALGRTFTEDEVAVGGQVVVISHGLWQRRYGAGRDALGSLLHVGARGYRVVGVLAAGVQHPQDVDVWRPLAPEETEDDDRELQVLARVAPGVPLATLEGQVQAVAGALAEARPETHAGISAWIQPLRDTVVRDVRTALLVFLGAVGLVLVITCVNTANLLLARSADRRHEVAIRAALGASRWGVVRFHMIESLVLALSGGALGVLLGRLTLQGMLAAIPRLPRLAEVSLDLRVLAVVAAVTTVAGLLFGVGPALRAASSDPDAVLRGGGGLGGRASRRHAGLQSTLVTTEIALSTVLVLLALVLFGSFRVVLEHDRGFDPEGLMAVSVDPPHGLEQGDEALAYFRTLVERVRAVSGVENAAVASHLMLEQRGFQTTVRVFGAPQTDEEEEKATTRIVTDGFFATAGVSLRSGRVFTAEGGTDDDAELVVNERFVRTWLPSGTDPLGAVVETEWVRGHIVGVVGDISPSVGEPARPLVYVPYARFALGAGWLLVRGDGDVAALGPDVWAVIRSLDRTVLPSETVVLSDVVRTSVAPQRFNMLLVASFAALALGLAAVGIYGVTSYTVALRQGEIGIRRALGASRSRVATEVARRIALLTAAGVLAGMVLAALSARLLGSLIFGVRPTDPAVLTAVAGLLAVVALVAMALPLSRAVGIAPTEALRNE